MANFLRRFWNIIRGKTNKMLDDFENPQEQLNLFARELDEQVSELRTAVSRALADEKRLRLEIEQSLEKASEWENRAILALEAGNEELARQALAKKEENESRSLERQKDWETQKEATKKLKTSLVSAKKQVDDAKRKYSLSLARYKSAAARKKIADTLTDQTGQSPMQAIEQLNERILSLEAETEASLELSEESLGTDLESKFVELENRQKSDQAFEQLKAAVKGKKAPAASLSARVDELRSKLDEN